MSKKMCIAKYVLMVLLLGGGVVIYLLGWFSDQRPWEQATGWNQITSPKPEVTHATIPGGPQIYWLGHSAMLLKWGDTTLFLDPNTSERCSVSHRILEPAIAVSNLPPIDAVLISHAHYDHMDMPTLKEITTIGEIVVPRGSEVYFDDPYWGEQTFTPLGLSETHTVDDIEITAVPAAHYGNRYHPLRSKYLAVGYIIRKGDVALYYAGDTARHNDFAHIRDTYHPDMALLPIGAYSPRFPLGWHHLNPEEAVSVAQELEVMLTVPCHFGTYTLSLDRPHAALPRFARAALTNKLHWIMPTLLRETNQLASTFHLAGRDADTESVNER